ncbi:hypothetical protein Emag_000802 [Eimeria magna]
MASGSQRGSLGADTMAQLQRYGDSKDWWILGSTNYAVVDPRKPEGSGELARKHFKPQKQPRGLSKLFLSGSGSGSIITEALDDLFLRESLSRRFGIDAGSRDGFGSKPHKTTSSDWQLSNAAMRTGSYLSYTTVTSGHAPSVRGSSSRDSLLYSSPRTLSFSSYRSGFMPLPSRASAGPHTVKLPSFRSIFQQQQTGEGRRRHLSDASPFLATSSKASFLRSPTRAPLFEQLPSRVRSRSYDPASAGLQQGSLGSLPKEEGGGEGLLRNLAKERLKRSVTRMQTASVSFMEADDEADTTQEAQTQHRNLHKAGQAVESLAGMMRLGSGGETLSGEALSPPLSRGLHSPLGFDLLGLLSGFNSGHYAALERTESDGETAAAHQRQKLLRCLKWLAENLQAASDFEAANRKTGASGIGLALAAYEALSEAWDSRRPAFSLVLPAALACLACATAHSICAVACMEVAVQTLHSKLMRWGLEEGPEETAVNYLRYATVHASLLEHQQLLNGLVIRTLGLVLARQSSSPKPQPPPSRTQEEDQQKAENKESLNSSSLELEEIQSLIAAAQSAISAAHVEAERASLANRKPSPHKLLFSVLELRLHVNKLLGLRLALCEVGCTRSAWSEVEAFKNHAQAYLSSLDVDN